MGTLCQKAALSWVQIIKSKMVVSLDFCSSYQKLPKISTFTSIFQHKSLNITPICYTASIIAASYGAESSYGKKKKFFLTFFDLAWLSFFFDLEFKLVELKNGETYNGHLVSCDNWMNINLREVICTSRVRKNCLFYEYIVGRRVTCVPINVEINPSQGRGLLWISKCLFCFRSIVYTVVRLFNLSYLFFQDGDRFWKIPECYIRGSNIKYLRIPDEVSMPLLWSPHPTMEGID